MQIILILTLFILVSCQKSILNDDDYKLNGEEKISSTLIDKDQWKSAFYWNCFAIEQIKIEKFFSDGANRDFPQLVIKYHDFIKRITLYTDVEVDAEKTIEVWKKLLDEQNLVCIYMGNLPGKGRYQEGEVFFYLEQIKTLKGSWSIPD